MPDMNLPVPVGQENTFAKISSASDFNPAQPRRHYSDERLQELVRSIKECGVLQPIRVAEIAAGEYQIIAGERRFRAAALLERKSDNISRAERSRKAYGLVFAGFEPSAPHLKTH